MKNYPFYAFVAGALINCSKPSLFFFILQVGLWIDAGSRFETAENNGVAHFLEHMIFKVILTIWSFGSSECCRVKEVSRSDID